MCQSLSLVLVIVGVYLLINRETFGINSFTNIVWGLMVTIFFTKLIFVTFPLAEDLFRGSKFAFQTLLSWFDTPSTPVSIDERRKAVSQIGLAVASIPFATFLYGVAKGRYDFTVRRQSLTFSDLPEEFDGFKVLQISDVHSGSFDSKEKVRKGIELIQKQEADVILFTGDIVNNSSKEIVPYIDLFKSLEAPYGKFATLGNHDYGHYARSLTVQEQQEDVEQLKRYHAQMGFNLMNNRSVKLIKGENSICIPCV
jgi:hypothetical protein